MIVFKVMLPKLCMLVRDEIPDTKEKNTNGTIKSFSRFIKIELPKLKTYTLINSRKLSEKKLI
jgi:hypothetical protein